MYRVDRNNFYKNEKKSDIETPAPLCNFLFNLLKDKIKKTDSIIDPCCGRGALLKPFFLNKYDVIGIDIDYFNLDYPFFNENYLNFEIDKIKNPSLIIINPPFNINTENKKFIIDKKKGRPLMAELFLHKTIELFTKNIPIVLFTPYGFRLNQTIKSKRWLKFINNEYPQIFSIISLPKNIFKDIQFHAEILIFNIRGLKAHYFYENGNE